MIAPCNERLEGAGGLARKVLARLLGRSLSGRTAVSIETAVAAMLEFAALTPKVERVEIPSGMALVPIEPTDAMWEAFDGFNGDKRTGYETWLKAWSAMLAAYTPATPAEQPDQRAGEVEDEARSDAWNDFFNEHLTDGNDGYIAADVIARCRAAFDAIADNPLGAATHAALTALAHPTQNSHTAAEVMREALKRIAAFGDSGGGSGGGYSAVQIARAALGEDA